MKFCCAQCQHWLEGVAPVDSYGWCELPRETEKNQPYNIEGDVYEGGSGIETQSTGWCPSWTRRIHPSKLKLHE